MISDVYGCEIFSPALAKPFYLALSGPWALFKTICIDFHQPFLQDAFSLLAYSDPWSSPVGWQLSAKERESVSAALNSAILDGRFGKPGRPPMEVALLHSRQLVKLMANNDLGACAFANVEDFIK